MRDRLGFGVWFRWTHLKTNGPDGQTGAATKAKAPSGQAAKEEAARLKAELYRICKGKDNGLKASEAETKQVLDLAERLGKLNQVGCLRVWCGMVWTV